MESINNVYLPKITIITVCFQAKHCIDKTIKSVLGQDYPNIEYIIQDGGSTDGTIEVVKSYPIIKFDSKKDRGVYDAMNVAVKRASGEWVLFMNAGDTFYADNVVSSVFNRQIPRSCFVLFGDTVSQNDKVSRIVRYRDLPWHKYMPSCHQSIFCKKELLQKYPFEIKWKIAADRAFFYKLYKKKYTYLYVPIIVSVYDNTGGISHDWLECTKEILKIQNPYCIYLIKYLFILTKYNFRNYFLDVIFVK